MLGWVERGAEAMRGLESGLITFQLIGYVFFCMGRSSCTVLVHGVTIPALP